MKMLTLTISTLLISSTYAFRCGQMSYTQCTDQECSVGCTTVIYQPQDCNPGFLQQTFGSGNVAAMCSHSRLRFQFYGDDTCTGQQIRDGQDYNYGTCTINDLGSAKLEPSGDQPGHYELTQAEYEERFNQRWNTGAELNVLGYGQRNLFVAPLMEPDWLLSEFDRYSLTNIARPLTPFLTEAFISAIGEASFSWVWYNNGEAAGQQLYPDSLNKYYDMWSWPGLSRFLLYWLWYQVCAVSTVFTILPANIWLGMINGMKFDDIWMVLIPSIFTWFFHIRGEKGWILN